MENFWAIIVAFSIPSLISGFAMWQIKRVITKSEDRKIAREQSRERHRLDKLEKKNDYTDFNEQGEN